MIKLIIFDLDGVLVESKETHYETLNLALAEIDSKYCITKDEHVRMYEGLPTKTKLNLLTLNKNLPINLHEKIWNRKQYYTDISFKNLKINQKNVSLLQKLKSENYIIAVATNSIRSTTETILKNTKIYDMIDIIVTNEDVQNPKPFPEIYWKCMSLCKILPKNTLIIEDSPIGRNGARNSGAHLFCVSKIEDVCYEKIKNFLNCLDEEREPMSKWTNNNLNILVPMAGLGSRFRDAGFELPKPLIQIDNKPMIKWVVDSLNIDANYIFIVQKEHSLKYDLNDTLNSLSPNIKIIYIDSVTEGAACTTLLAEKFIDNDNPLLIVNSDQYIEWDSHETMYYFERNEIDGGILTFKDTNPKWSFAKINESDYVTEVAEKRVISDNATVGVYFWKKGSDYVKYCKQMINNNIRVNNEFYVCPVFNEAIKDGKKIKIKHVKEMWGLGTPEDMKVFINEKMNKL